jgi:hypothetical protein
MSLVSTSEYGCSAPVRCPQAPNTSPGVAGSPSRHELLESTRQQVSYACLRSAHNVSHVLDGLLLLEPCGFISSHCHVRDYLFRGFPHQSADLTHRQFVPSCCWRLSPAARLPHPHQIWPPHLQGFDPTADPLPPTGLLRLPMSDPLLSFHSLGFISEHPENAFTSSPLIALDADSSSDSDN